MIKTNGNAGRAPRTAKEIGAERNGRVRKLTASPDNERALVGAKAVYTILSNELESCIRNVANEGKASTPGNPPEASKCKGPGPKI
jgi:hypothetical protein